MRYTFIKLKKIYHDRKKVVCLFNDKNGENLMFKAQKHS
jgi:hypothetical protein